MYRGMFVFLVMPDDYARILHLVLHLIGQLMSPHVMEKGGRRLPRKTVKTLPHNAFRLCSTVSSYQPEDDILGFYI